MVYEAMEPMSDLGLNFLAVLGRAGSPSEESLRLLASWTATQEQQSVRADSSDPTRVDGTTHRGPGERHQQRADGEFPDPPAPDPSAGGS